MGPGDPFASRSAPRDPAPSRTPSAPASVASEPAPRARADAPPSGSGAAPSASPEPFRVQARLPDAPRSAPMRASRAALVGGAAGLVVGLLLVTLGPGATAVVAALAALGALLGTVLRSLFADGIDVGGAWRALRRR